MLHESSTRHNINRSSRSMNVFVDLRPPLNNMAKSILPGIRFEDLKFDAQECAKPSLICGTPFMGFVGNSERCASLANMVFPNITYERNGNFFIFASLENFLAVQEVFNSDVALRNDRLILDKEFPRHGSFSQDPTIVANKVLRIGGALDWSSSKARIENNKLKPQLLSSLFELAEVRELADSFNEAVMFGGKAKDWVGPPDFFLALACTSPDAAAKFHSVGRSISGRAVSFVSGAQPFQLKEAFSCKARSAAAREEVASPSWYQIRVGPALAQRNVDTLNRDLSAKLGACSTPRVVLGHPDYSPKGPCFFVSVALQPATAVESLSFLVSRFAPQDLAEPKSNCVFGPYNPKSFGTCLHCGFGHYFRECDRIVRPPSSAPPSAVKKSPEPCRNYLAGRSCPGDVNCRFTHPVKSRGPVGGPVGSRASPIDLAGRASAARSASASAPSLSAIKDAVGLLRTIESSTSSSGAGSASSSSPASEPRISSSSGGAGSASSSSPA